MICSIHPDLGLNSNDEDKIMLRDKSGEDKLTQVYHNDRDLIRYQIYDGKEIAIQIVKQDLSNMDSYLIMVKMWNSETWEISPAKEINIHKTSTLQ